MGDLPPGYRFSPTEEELLCFYLQNKLHNLREDMERVIPVVNMYNMDPWQLPRISGERRIQDSEQWFFFCPQQEKEAHGGRPTRTTPTGYWKATGSPGLVYSSSNRVIGVKKTMAFYKGRAPTGSKTKWKMNEYKAFEEDSTIPQATTKLRSEFSLCRVYLKSGCVRSFDRRPSLAVPNATASRGKATASGSNAGDFAAEKTDSHDSSSSSGMGFPQSVFGEAIDWKMLEEFDWD